MSQNTHTILLRWSGPLRVIQERLESSIMTSYKRLNIQNWFYPAACSQLSVLEMLHCKLSQLNNETLSLLLISLLIREGRKCMWLLVNMASSLQTSLLSNESLASLQRQQFRNGLKESVFRHLIFVSIVGFCNGLFSQVLCHFSLLWEHFLHFSSYGGAWIPSPVIWKSPNLKCSSHHFCPQNILALEFLRN